jgi:hypothetical protein
MVAWWAHCVQVLLRRKVAVGCRSEGYVSVSAVMREHKQAYTRRGAEEGERRGVDDDRAEGWPGS